MPKKPPKNTDAVDTAAERDIQQLMALLRERSPAAHEAALNLFHALARFRVLVEREFFGVPRR